MSNTYVQNNHYSFLVEKKVKAISNPLKEKGIKEFFHIRVFPDYTLSVLTTNANYNQTHINNSKYLISRATLERIRNQRFFIPTHDDEIDENRQQFGLSRPLGIVHKHKGYVDLFFFYAAPHDQDYINLYLNHRDYFEHFTKYYTKAASRLIHKAYLHRLKLTTRIPRAVVALAQQNELDKSRCVLDCGMLKILGIELSPKEQICLSYFAQGYTSEETAKKIYLSKKTVDDYVTRIVRKLGCKNKHSIVRFCYENHLLKFD